MDKYDLKKVKKYDLEYSPVVSNGNSINFSDSIDEDQEPLMLYYIAFVIEKDEKVTLPEIEARLIDIRGYSSITQESLYFLRHNQIIQGKVIDNVQWFRRGPGYDTYTKDIDSCTTKKYRISVLKDSWND